MLPCLFRSLAAGSLAVGLAWIGFADCLAPGHWVDLGSEHFGILWGYCMPKRFLSSIIALSVAVSPLSAASAETYVFRYKSPLTGATAQPPEVDDTVYGIGNDIVAYYVAPIGYGFSKKIPVATRDVVEWRKDSGSVPSGIDLDVAAGVFSGTPTTEEAQTTLYHGYDAGGNRIARAEIHFTVFEPVGVPSVVDFYAHTGTYFFGEIPNPEDVTVHRWEPLVDYAEGMSMLNAAFQGTPAKAGTYGVAWRGYDFLDREVAFAYGDFLVTDGPVVEELLADSTISEVFGDQISDKTRSETFSVTPTVQRALGPVTYKLVPETARPSGLTFASSSGKLGGVYDDFETTASFRIQARDSYDGTTGLSNVFTLATLPADADLSAMPNLVGVVGTPFYRKLTAQNLAPGAKWSLLQGTLPDNIALNADMGELKGTPTKTETLTGLVFGVSGPGMIAAENNPPIQFRIYSEALEASTTPLHVRINTPFETAGMNVTKGGSEGYTVSTGILPGDLTIAGDTGKIASSAGIAAAGSYDRQVVVESADRRVGFAQILRAYNPLGVSYENIEVVRHGWLSRYPSLAADSIIGAAKYTIKDTDGDPVPSWLSLNGLTGRLTGIPSDVSTAGVTFGPYVVTLKDDQDSVPSQPFTIKVNDRADLEVSVVDKDVQRYVNNGYWLVSAKNAYAGITFELASTPSNWPSTLKLSRDGVLYGTTTDPVGTVYSGLAIKATDGEGYTDTSSTFDLTVIEPEALGGLFGWLDKTIEWTEGQAFTDTLPPLRNGFGAVAYAFAAASSDVAITNAATGAISGTVSSAGTVELGYTIDDDTDRAPATGKLTLKINPQPQAAADQEYELHRAAIIDQNIPTVTGGTQPFTFALQGALPKGLSFYKGRFYGTPSEEGEFSVSVTATDRAGAIASASFTLKVGAPLPLEISYDTSSPLYYGKSGAGGVLLAPQVANALGAVTWTAAAGDLPPGVQFVTSGANAGRFVGTPTATGRWNGVTVSATDGEGRPASVTVDLVVSRTGEIEFGDATIKHRKGLDFTDTLSVKNVVDPVTFSSADPSGMPYGLVLNGTAGTVTGSFADEGSYPVGVTAVDDMGRQKSATITYQIVGDFAVAASDVTLKQYVAATGSPAAVATNAVGTVSYALASGTLPTDLRIDASTGAVVGSTDQTGTFSNLVIEATDADGTKAVSEPFAVTVEERAPLALAAPAALSLKRHSVSGFAASVADAIPPVQYNVTPDLPQGLTLDANTGAISGSSSELVADTVYTLTAVDSKGGQLGTDVAQFTLSVAERDPLGIEGPSAYNFAKYFPGEAAFAAVNAIDGSTFSISPALPDGISLNSATGTISGTASAAAAAGQYTLTVTDAHDSFDKLVTIEVGDRLPLVIATPESQVAILGHNYALTLEAENTVPGDSVVWEHVSGDLPAGVTFDAATGAFSGTPTEFGVTSTVTIRATDGFEGSAEKTFTFTIQQDGTPITLAASGATTRVGQPFTIPAPTAANLVGDYEWSVDAGATGLVINRKTGQLAGTPSSTFTGADVTLTVRDVTGREATRAIKVTSAPKIVVSAPSALNLTYNYDAPSDSKSVATDTVGAVTWTYTGTLPQGLSFDAATGAFVGKPKQLGTFGPIQVTAADTLPGTTMSGPITVKVVMNNDPIELSVTDFKTKIGHPVETAVPAYGNELGPVTFFSTDLAGTGLTINSSTGVLSGTPTELMDRYINVSIRDRDTTRVTSKPLHLQVLPLMQITVPAQVTISALTDITPVAPTRTYAIGTAVWNELDQSVSKLPEGIVFDTAAGTFEGNAKEIGTFGPFTVSSIDSLGDTGVSNSFVIKSNPGAYFIGLAGSALPDAIKRIETYGFDFKSVLTNVGMDESEIIWSLGGASPPGLAIANGILSGTPSLSGTYTFDVTAKFGSVDAKRSYTLVVKLPETELGLQEAMLPQAKRRSANADNTYTFDFKALTTPLTNISADKVVYTIEPFAEGERVPAGLTLSNGTLTGVADDGEGTYAFRVTARFADGTDENVSVTTAYSLELIDDISFEFNGVSPTGAMKRVAYAFDLGSMIDDETLTGITKNELAWSWSLDPARDTLTTRNDLPTGLAISGTSITGTAVHSGKYGLILTASFDGREISTPVSFSIDLPETKLALKDGSLSAGEFQAAYSFDMKTLLDIKNIPASAVTWQAQAPTGGVGAGETAGLPPGIGMQTTGALSGAGNSKGTYKFDAVAKWSDTNAQAESLEARKTYAIVINGVSYSYKQISVGRFHACGVTLAGGVQCWGQGDKGQNGSTGLNYTLPTNVSFLSGVTKVATGDLHTCALLDNGDVKCFGKGTTYQLGNGGTNDVMGSAVKVEGLGGPATDVVAGFGNTCAILEGGVLKCWGYNANAQLGIGNTTVQPTPVEVLAGTPVQSVALSSVTSCAVTQSGAAKCWGSNVNGNVGTGTTNPSSYQLPQPVSGLSSGVKKISLATSSSCALMIAGNVKCWGSGVSGQLGNGVNTGVYPTPSDVPGITGIDIGSGEGTHCVGLGAGGLKCWGNNGNGQAGTGSTGTALTPTAVVGITEIVRSVSGGNAHTCALLASGQAKCWGYGSNGRLGNGSTLQKETPQTVGG